MRNVTQLRLNLANRGWVHTEGRSKCAVQYTWKCFWADIVGRSKWGRVTTMLRWSWWEIQPAARRDHYVRLNGFDRFPLTPPPLISEVTAGAHAHMHEHTRTRSVTQQHTPGSLSCEGTSCYYSKCGVNESNLHQTGRACKVRALTSR